MIDLLYTDETRFTLTTCVSQCILRLAAQGRANRHSECQRLGNEYFWTVKSAALKVFTTQESINSDFIIECVDQIAQGITRLTVLVFDNAPWHKAEKILQRQGQWQQKGLFIFFLPPYSPHLNPIETLWRKIKHEWLKPNDYASTQTLKNAVYHIIKNYDNLFSIKFSKNEYV